MRSLRQLIVAGLLLASTAPFSGLQAEDLKHLPPGKTSWISFRNGNQQLGIATSPLPEKLELLWKVPSQDGFVAAVAIVGNHVYAPTLSGDLLCLERKTGKKVWSYRSIDSTDPKEFAPGFKAAPRITDDLAIIGDEEGVIHAV
ncbi:MAG: PQQ-binding-like beta-propeller repeat protein, partial [Planctomycetota bacterium]|nr:PQQ-binding-like beta-propeller repeat protein [Planctomycetota bacterium]